MSAVDDMKAVVESAMKNPYATPNEGDVRYFLAVFMTGHLEIWEMVVTNLIKKDSTSPLEQVRGYKYRQPNIGITLNPPYPLFKSREELCEHYRKVFE